MTSPPSRRARLHGLAGRVGLAALSLGFSLLFAELALRLALPPPAVPEAGDAWRYPFFAYHERLGWDLVPGAESELTLPEATVVVRINGQGLRSDRTYRMERSPGVRRIVVVGDSFTFGYGVENDEIYTAVLERLLDGTEVVNLGVTGYGTDQQLLKLLDQGLAFHPDQVLVGLFVGDVFRNARSEQLGYAKPRFELDGGELRLAGVPVPHRPPPPGLARRSALGRLLLGRGRELVEHLGFGDAWPLTEAIVGRMRDACAAAGCGVRVVIIPKDQAVYGRGLRRRLHHHATARLAALLERQGVAYLDLTPALAARAGDERLYFEHDGHWTAAGHRVAAEAIAAWLKRP